MKPHTALWNGFQAVCRSCYLMPCFFFVFKMHPQLGNQMEPRTTE